MTTDKQIDANRRNARRSTGPNTPEGKAAAARNGTKHGLRSQDTVLSDEDAEVFGHMQRELYYQLQPEGEVETFLLKRIAVGIWRLQRILRVEAALFEEPETFYFDKGKGLAARFRSQSRSGGNIFATLCRYESTMERSVYRALHELQRLQAVRRGENVPPPMALDVLLSTGGGQ